MLRGYVFQGAGMLRRFALAVIGLASMAHAQDAEFARFVDQTTAAAPAPTAVEVAPGALEVVQALAHRDGGCVPTAVQIDQPQSATATLLVTQLVRAGQIRNGWTAYGRLVGCPAGDPVRFIILRRADGQLLVREINVGESLANVTLMRDSGPAAAIAAHRAVARAHPECASANDVKMVRTRVISKSADLGPDYHGARYRGSWSEGWTFRACGHSAEGPISFRADGQSGAYWDIKADQARLLD
ncbi:MAG: hypothetical protein JO258_14985 [Alphaproteobacteria bacterium]|nr:hypothetical protein [Alphaproteobacteria bacterium]